MTRRIVAIVLALGLGVMIFAGCGLDTNTVAKVGDWKLSVDEFKDEVMKKYRTPERAASATQEDLERLLDELVIEQLKTVDAYNKGLDSDPEIKEAYDQEIERQVVRKLFESEIRDKVVSEADIRDFYDNDVEELHASHILIKTENRSEEEARALADKVYNLAIAPGAKFSKLAKEYSEDETSQVEGGDLDWFRYGRMVEPFQDAVFAMKTGEISKPVKTEYGWHVINLHERRKVKDRKPFPEAKEDIRQQLLRQRGKQVEAAATDFIEREKTNRGLVYNKENLASVKSKIETNERHPGIFALLTQEEQEMEIASFDDGQKKVLMSDIKDNLNKVGQSGMEIDWVEDIGPKLIDQFIMIEYLLPDAAKKLGYYEDAKVLEKAKTTRDRKVLYEAKQQMVLQKSEPTNEQVKEYYNAHSEEFMTEVQVTLIEILVGENDKELAKELVERAKTGENMRDMALKYSIREDVKETKGVLGPIKKTQYGVIGKEAVKTAVGEVRGPIIHGKNWSVFKVISKEEPQVEDFEKVKAKVETAVRRQLRNESEENWVKSLKSSIPYKVNTKPLANLTFEAPEN
ncbi:peptidylprolyl isomerase [bacterium]|nr:peptidylprolyl isomerase [bacterium]